MKGEKGERFDSLPFLLLLFLFSFSAVPLSLFFFFAMIPRRSKIEKAARRRSRHMREMKEKRVSFFSFFDKLTPSPQKQKTGKKNSQAPGGVPFFAAGISSVMHPHNPFAPTMHFNYRYFETEDWNGVPGQWWFGAFLMFFFFLRIFFSSFPVSFHARKKKLISSSTLSPKQPFLFPQQKAGAPTSPLPTSTRRT